MSIAHEAYLLTLEPSFIDSNLYIQRLIQHVAAMDNHEQGEFASERRNYPTYSAILRHVNAVDLNKIFTRNFYLGMHQPGNSVQNLGK